MDAHDPKARIGNDERDGAVESLRVHFTQGRLDVDEFEDRCAKVFSATTVAELDTVFTDLPLPHYDTGLAVYEAPASLAQAVEGVTAIAQNKKLVEKWMDVGWVLAGLFIPFGLAVLGLPFWFSFLPMIVMIVLSILIDDDEDDEDELEEAIEDYREHKRKRKQRKQRKRDGLSADDI